MQNREINRLDYLALASILAIATVLRAVELDSPLWYDEMLTLTGSVRLPLRELIFDHASFNNHPFYSLQAKAAIWLFGESNWALRLPAAIFGVASVGAIWRLACLISDPLRAHVAALLVAVSYHHIWYSQNARAYTELMFWFVASTIVLIRGVRSPAMKTWVLYGLVVAAGLYTHLTAATFFIAQAIIIIAILGAPILRRRTPAPDPENGGPALDWRMPAAAYLIGGVMTIGLYARSVVTLLGKLNAMPSASQVDVMAEYQSPIWTLLEMVRTVASPGPFVLLVALSVVGLVVIGIIATRKREWIPGATVLIHIPLTLVVLLAMSARIWPRFFFADMGFVLLFLSEGVFASCVFISRTARKHVPIIPSGRALFVTAAAMMLVISSILAARNYRFPKQDFDGALQFIESERGETDAVVTLGLAAAPYTDYFETGWPTVGSVDDLRVIESGAPTTWLVMAFPTRTSRKFVDVMEHLDLHYSLASTFRGTLGDGNVLVYVGNVDRGSGGNR